MMLFVMRMREWNSDRDRITFVDNSRFSNFAAIAAESFTTLK
jgi:hypothetical protein